MSLQQGALINRNHENILQNRKTSKLVQGEGLDTLRVPLRARNTNLAVSGDSVRSKTKQLPKVSQEPQRLKTSKTGNLPILRSTLPAHISDIDADDADFLEFSAVYVKDIYEYLFRIESDSFVHPQYLQKHPTLRAHMRMILVEWLVSLQGRFRLLQETLLMTVSILDRFMSETDTEVSRGKFQLVGVSCLLVACKYEEMYLPSVSDFAYMCDGAYTQENILRMERLILDTLKFELSKPLSAHFLRRFSKAGGADSVTHTIAKYFLELAIYDYALVHCKPSVIAASALMIAGKITDEVHWNDVLSFYSRYEAEDLNFVVTRLSEAGATAETNKYLKTTFKKYAADKFQRVARTVSQSEVLNSLIGKNSE